MLLLANDCTQIMFYRLRMPPSGLDGI